MRSFEQGFRLTILFRLNQSNLPVQLRNHVGQQYLNLILMN